MRIDNGNDSEVIWSDNKSLVNLLKTYFELLWEKARKFEPEQKLL
jgi:hypothetical protein